MNIKENSIDLKNKTINEIKSNLNSFKTNLSNEIKNKLVNFVIKTANYNAIGMKHLLFQLIKLQGKDPNKDIQSEFIKDIKSVFGEEYFSGDNNRKRRGSFIHVNSAKGTPKKNVIPAFIIPTIPDDNLNIKCEGINKNKICDCESDPNYLTDERVIIKTKDENKDYEKCYGSGIPATPDQLKPDPVQLELPFPNAEDITKYREECAQKIKDLGLNVVAAPVAEEVLTVNTDPNYITFESTLSKSIGKVGDNVSINDNTGYYITNANSNSNISYTNNFLTSKDLKDALEVLKKYANELDKSKK